ncbi:XRE family transcriptional regulator [Paenibacillus larvae]|uniref:XRE family transcriptional regulator n=1 Tax=Paenibacillus larvae TaxID=1464 RepID=UPI0024CC8FAC|nr:helix-turn-helix domain transcriptional regulator [Paenibacillus phage LunBun]UYE92140.1 helix-turn-helix domain transcriptional regulator [Paenibacillus phage BarryFoster_Benicio]UYL91504.1 helix-turn-helix domain transcriptional regulator [Paenibacillus phage ABAtENZ]UYL91586.1 helix-turn-helix domain transcriptional regulator [Paenibacillus phage AJG77]UYL91668.1 helix-turn-helix domain transcriptional regulator [Paenibacillus phage ApiWellbeing]UYL91750.1 helix-turn-helix domain transcr
MLNYSEFGAEARKIMLVKDIKMVDMAKELGISTTYLAEILKGTRKGTKQKPKIAEMLGMRSEVTQRTN